MKGLGRSQARSQLKDREAKRFCERLLSEGWAFDVYVMHLSEGWAIDVYVRFCERLGADPRPTRQCSGSYIDADKEPERGAWALELACFFQS